jgi:hypothetical protein
VCSYTQSQDGLTSATAMRRASNTISTLFAHALSGNRLGLRRGLGANDTDPEFESLRVPRRLNRPGMSGDSTSWEGWGHVRWFVEEVSAGAA